jgi:hypothetical protein
VYLVPLYVSSSQNSFPQLKFVVAVLGDNVALGQASSPGGPRAYALQEVLSSALPVSSVGPQGEPTAPQAADVRSLLSQALAAEAKANADLMAGKLALYQSEEDAAGTLVKEALKEFALIKTRPAPPSTSGKSHHKHSGGSSTSTTTTTVAPAPSGSSGASGTPTGVSGAATSSF